VKCQTCYTVVALRLSILSTGIKTYCQWLCMVSQ